MSFGKSQPAPTGSSGQNGQQNYSQGFSISPQQIQQILQILNPNSFGSGGQNNYWSGGSPSSPYNTQTSGYSWAPHWGQQSTATPAPVGPHPMPNPTNTGVTPVQQPAPAPVAPTQPAPTPAPTPAPDPTLTSPSPIAFNPANDPAIQSVLQQHPGWTSNAGKLAPSWGMAPFTDQNGQGVNADGTLWQIPGMVAPQPAPPGGPLGPGVGTGMVGAQGPGYYNPAGQRIGFASPGALIGVRSAPVAPVMPPATGTQ